MKATEIPQELLDLNTPELFPAAETVAASIAAFVGLSMGMRFPLEDVAGGIFEMLRKQKKLGNFHGDSEAELATIAVAALRLLEAGDEA
jgi:hypothetical protein